MATTTTTSSTGTISMSNTPQAVDDIYSFSENDITSNVKLYNVSTQTLMLNVMSNDLGGNAKTLYSIDDGKGNVISGTDFDLIVKDVGSDGTSAWERTTAGNWVRINNGQIEFALGAPDGISGAPAGATGPTDKMGFDSLKGTDVVNDSFVYAIRLGNGTLSEAHVTLTIHGSNDAATITGYVPQDIIEKGGSADMTTPGDPVGGTLTVQDADRGESIFQTPASLAGNYGNFSFNSNTGQWSYALSNDSPATQALNVGDIKHDYLTVKSLDGTASQIIDVTIHGTNDAAVISGTSTASITETDAVQGTGGTLSATDVDSSAAFVALTDAAGSNGYGKFSIDASGHWTYTMNSAHNEFVGGKTYTDSIVVQTADGTQQKLTVTITGTNDAPVITSGSTASQAENTATSHVVYQAGASDADAGDTSFTYSLSGDDAARFNIDAQTGAVTFRASPNFEAPADADQDNVYHIVVTATDAHGLAGQGQAVAITVTNVNDVAPVITGFTRDSGQLGDHITNDSHPGFSGTAESGTTVVVYDGKNVLGSTTTGSDGHWSVSIDTQAELADGVHVISATSSYAGSLGDILQSQTLSLTIDTTIATPTVALTHDTGSSNSDGITKDGSLTFSDAAKDVTRSYVIDGAAPVSTYTAPMEDGPHTVKVVDTDTAGNTASSTISFTLDNTIATPTVALTHDTGSSNSDGITKDGSLTFSDAAKDVTRSYVIDGAAPVSTYTAPMEDGPHTVKVVDTDTAGNTASSTVSFTLDNTIATPTVALTHDTGSSNSDGITKDGSLTFSDAAKDVTRSYVIDGKAADSYIAPMEDGPHTVKVFDTDTAGNTASSTVSFTLDNTIATPTVALTHDTGSSNSDGITKDGSLTFSDAANDVTRSYVIDGAAPVSTYVAPMEDGPHTVKVVDTDTAGNTASSTISFTLDNTIATPTVALTHDTGSSNSDGITKDGSLTFSDAANDVTRSYVIDGAAPVSTYVAPTEDGPHTVKVVDTDTAGNTASSTISFTLDNTIATPTVALTHDTGSSNSDGITKDGSLTFSDAANDVTRSYVIDGAAPVSTYVAPTEDGPHTVKVVDTDTAGNTASSTISFTLDNTIATPTVALTHDTGSSNSDGITKDGSLTFSDAAKDVTRSYVIDGAAPVSTYTAPTEDGPHTVKVVDTDTAGNTASSTISFTLDNTIATPTVALTHDTGSSNSDGITKDGSLTFSDAAKDVTRSYVIDGAAPVSTYTAPTEDGPHTVKVVDTDTAGNTASSTISFTLDNTIATPTVALTHDTGSSNSDGITKDGSLTFSDAANDVTRSYVIDGAAPVSTYVAPTEDGPHTVKVVDTDTAGNTASSTISFTLDNTIATPTVALSHDSGIDSDRLTNNGSLNISAAAGDVSRVITVNGAAVDHYTAPTVDGTYVVQVTDTDTAGNTASSSLTFTLDKTIATPTVALSSDSGSDHTDKLTNDASLTFSTPSETVTRTYSVDGATPVSSYAVPTGDGQHTVQVTDTDAAGNTASSSITFTLDKTIATPTVALTHDTGSSSSDRLTNDASLTFSTPSEAVTRTYIVDNGTATSTYTAPTADGPHTVKVVDTDTAGNTANSSITFTLDKTIATSTVALSVDSGSDHTDKLTNDASLTFSTPSEAVTRTYSVDNGVVSSSYTAPAANGQHTVVVTDTDAAGNTASSSITFTLDKTAPAAGTLSFANLIDSGSSQTDGLTNDNAFNLRLSGQEQGASVMYEKSTDGGTTWTTTTASQSALADGNYSFHAVVTDAAGNPSTTNAISVTIDRTAPTAKATVTELSQDTGSSSSDFVTRVASQTVSGTLDTTLGSGEKVQVSADGGSTWVDATVSGKTWSAADVALSSSGTVLSVRTIDMAGNVTVGVGHGYTLDTTPPAAPTLHDVLNAKNASYDNGFTVDSGAAVSVMVNGIVLTSAQLASDFTLKSDGATDTYTAKANVFVGSETIKASATIADTAGNTSSAATLNLQHIDTTGPTVDFANNSATYSNSSKTWTLKGTYSDNASGTISIIDTATSKNNAAVGTTTVNSGAGVSWTIVDSSVDLTTGNGSNATRDSISITATDAAGNSTVIARTAPAGIAGEAINLGLSHRPEITDVLVNVSLPSGWILAGGTMHQDGSWTIQTDDLSALAVIAPSGSSGATVLNVSASWTNADGTTSTMSIADNMEVYAKGSPIFAWSGDDHLTASSGADTFVIAQPIGHDVIYKFDTAADKVDLIGYAGFHSFADVQSHLSQDAAGNAVITLGDGQVITLQGVQAAALTADNFVFDQTPTMTNTGTMALDDGTMLPLSGDIHNSGTIALNSAGSETDLLLIGNGITLQGGGHVTLSDSGANVISGTGAAVTLHNVDNTISGAGQIGAGQMSLVNEGSIIATGSNALVIDTGANTVHNSGTLEAVGSGGMHVMSAVDNTGTLWANGAELVVFGPVSGEGHGLISGSGTLEFMSASSAHANFAADAAGTLKLDDVLDFTGSVSGMDGNDKLDLGDLHFSDSLSLSYAANADGSGGKLTVSDGSHTASIALTGQYDAGSFHAAADTGSGTLVTYTPTSIATQLFDPLHQSQPTSA
ncbi:Ig-like domain-containing protein [Noviherbaspirillum pedocola]|uniref:VCBS domain-containing protein n=1 Tax=Noviherbaspirillum pedocola TaxID=2801341 RepID=A0A934SNK1_9BURK|nr:Ig-like domain-containing protein [Noviherbaspirillum pedocola]MBK4733831.1 VCBS domain-containing protein [Noviherbaspirillum pedocola]